MRCDLRSNSASGSVVASQKCAVAPSPTLFKTSFSEVVAQHLPAKRTFASVVCSNGSQNYALNQTASNLQQTLVVNNHTSPCVFVNSSKGVHNNFNLTNGYCSNASTSNTIPNNLFLNNAHNVQNNSNLNNPTPNNITTTNSFNTTLHNDTNHPSQNSINTEITLNNSNSDTSTSTSSNTNTNTSSNTTNTSSNTNTNTIVNTTINATPSALTHAYNVYANADVTNTINNVVNTPTITSMNNASIHMDHTNHASSPKVNNNQKNNQINVNFKKNSANHNSAVSSLEVKPETKILNSTVQTRKSYADSLALKDKSSPILKEEVEAKQPVVDENVPPVKYDFNRRFLPCWLTSPAKSLHEEMELFCQYISPTQEEVIMRNDVISRIEALVKEIWPNAYVKIFGSFSTQSYLPTSDIDAVVFGAQCMENEKPISVLAAAMRNKGNRKIQVIHTAKVPVIKMQDHKSSCLVDITFNVPNGPENTHLLKSFLLEYPLAIPLALVVKYYLYLRRLNETYYGGIGSFSILIMIISFLQLHCKTRTDKKSEEDLGVLLMDFFCLYGKTFDYENNGISIREGGFYFSKQERSWLDSSSPYLLSIEDPHNTESDVGRLSFGVRDVKQAFSEAYETLVATMNQGSCCEQFPSILGSIVYIDSRLRRQRQFIKELYGSESQPSLYRRRTFGYARNGVSRERKSRTSFTFRDDVASTDLTYCKRFVKHVAMSQQSVVLDDEDQRREEKHDNLLR